jgi:hypothetical protein
MAMSVQADHLTWLWTLLFTRERVWGESRGILLCDLMDRRDRGSTDREQTLCPMEERWKEPFAQRSRAIGAEPLVNETSSEWPVAVEEDGDDSFITSVPCSFAKLNISHKASLCKVVVCLCFFQST